MSVFSAPRLFAGRPGAVQLPLRHVDEGVTARRLESLAVFTVFAGLFGALGYWIVCELHVVGFDALDRLTRAMMVWRNDPPKLAAVGFVFAPLTTIALLPFTAFAPLGSSLIALPLCSAILGGLMMVAVNRIFARSNVGPARVLLVAAVAVNPIVAFAATTGSGAIVGVALSTLGVVALVAWYATVDTRYLVSGGAAFGLACMASYEFIAWLVLAAAVIGVTLARHRAEDSEVEGSLILYLIPGIFLVGLWILANTLVVGEPFAWLTDSTTTTINAKSSAAVGTDLGHALGQTVDLVAGGSPITFAVLPALIGCAVLQRNAMAGWLAAFVVVAIATPTVEALVQDDASELVLRDALPILMVSVVAIAWLHHSLVDARTLVTVVAVLGLAVSLPISWHALDTYPYQSMEQAFHRAVSTGDDQEGTLSRGGLEVGVLSERAMAGFIRADRGEHRILTDNAQTFGVIALTGRPQAFLDRADRGDAHWRAAVRQPPRSVDYFLFAKNASADMLRRTYPRAASGDDPRFRTLYDTPRYRLVAIPSGLGRRAGTTP